MKNGDIVVCIKIPSDYNLTIGEKYTVITYAKKPILNKDDIDDYYMEIKDDNKLYVIITYNNYFKLLSDIREEYINNLLF